MRVNTYIPPFTESRTYLLATRLLALSSPQKPPCEPPRSNAFPVRQINGVDSSSHRLHPVQLAVCRAKQGLNRFAVLGIDSHADARGKPWLETIRGETIEALLRTADRE